MSDQDTSGLVLIIDALNLFTRHFVAHPALGINGDHVGGIVGFLYAIVNFAEKYSPKSIIVVWEGGGSPRRRAIYPDYKAKRKPERLNRHYEEIPDTIQNRNHQISTIVNILNKVPIQQVYVPDCEADDIIGYLSRYKFKDTRKVIISSDKDFYQLLDKKTIIYSPTWKKIVTSKEVVEKFNILPSNFALAKSICGDVSDNISGVPRVGFKTLARRFPILKTSEDVMLEEIVNVSNLEISGGSNLKVFQNIVDNQDLAKRNWKLIFLDTSNLAASQIKKINDIIDTFSPERNKIDIMRTLLKEGIQTFNVDRMFLAFNHIGVKK